MTIGSGAALFLAALSGAVMGGFFFWGLYWTIRRGLDSRVPAVWFALSLLVRITVVVFGFYLVVGDGSWSRLLACSMGFIVARIAAGRIICDEEVGHAP